MFLVFVLPLSTDVSSIVSSSVPFNIFRQCQRRSKIPSGFRFVKNFRGKKILVSSCSLEMLSAIVRFIVRAFDDRNFINEEENISSVQFSSRHCRDRTEIPKASEASDKGNYFYFGPQIRLTKCNLKFKRESLRDGFLSR